MKVLRPAGAVAVTHSCVCVAWPVWPVWRLFLTCMRVMASMYAPQITAALPSVYVNCSAVLALIPLYTMHTLSAARALGTHIVQVQLWLDCSGGPPFLGLGQGMTLLNSVYA
jgi:hypothetical protein